jgi:uncharacterized membrane protein YhaH (DUF805 family)
MKKLLLLFSFYGSSSRESHFKMLGVMFLGCLLVFLGLRVEVILNIYGFPLMSGLIGIANLLGGLSLIVLYYAQLWKRSHDIGVSGWWVFFIYLITVSITLKIGTQENFLIQYLIQFPALIIYTILGYIPSKNNNNKFNNEKEEKLTEEKGVELIQEKYESFGAYQQQFKNKKKGVKDKNFFNFASRLRFWITLHFLLALVYDHMTATVPLFDVSMAGAGFVIFIMVINVVTWIARARASGINFLWVIAMFIPYLNFIAVYLLGVTPSKDMKKTNI